MTTFVSRQRWPLLIGAALSILVLWRLEHHRARSHRATTTRASDSERRGVPSVRWSNRPVPPHRWPRLDGLHSVSGRVIEIESGVGLAGVEVTFSDGRRAGHTTSVDDGYYQITLAPGRYQATVASGDVIAVTAPRRQRPDTRALAAQLADGPRNLAPDLDVSHDVSDIDVEVVRAVTVRGTVHDRAGHAIAGAVVSARVQDRGRGQPVDGSDRAETDGDGRFALVVAARPQQLQVEHPDYAGPDTSEILDLTVDTRADLDITMIRGCIITGRVVRDGVPFGDGEIQRATSQEAPRYGHGGTFNATDGFRIATDEEITLVLRATPWGGASSAPQVFDCRGGGSHAGIVFEIPHATPSLSGAIVTAAGVSVPFAFLDILGSGENQTQERADANGNWEAHDLPPDTYTVITRVPREGLARVRIAAPGGHAMMRLSGTGALAGYTTGLVDGSFMLDVDCHHETRTWGHTGERFVVSIFRGRYFVADVPACNVVVTASSHGWTSPESTIDVPPGDTAILDLDLSALATQEIQGHVHDLDGRPFVAALISIVEQPAIRTRTSARGDFIVRAPAGKTLSITAADAFTAVTVPAGSSALDVLLPRLPPPP